MKFTHSRETLLEALQATLSAIEKKQTAPILENVLIQVRDGAIHWRGTNLELEVAMSTPIIDATPGEVTLPARKLFDICKSLPAESMIEFDIQDTRAKVSYGRSRFELIALPASEFPDLEDIQINHEFLIPENIFKQLFDSVGFAMANQDVRYYLNGLLLELIPSHVRSVATDGHRLSLYTHLMSTNVSDKVQAIIPRKSILELTKLLRSDNQTNIKVQLSSNHLRVQLDNLRFTTKLVDGRYPDYQAAVPPQGKIRVEIDRKELKEVLARVAILSNEKFRGVRLELGNNKLKVQSNNPEQESAQDEIDVLYQGEEFSIGFNVNYLLDAVNHLESDTMYMNFNSPESSALITDPHNDNIRNVVMPIRL
ncbi:MAG: DNA polymerase III subunit beta [Thiofilum sp.]|uniref:DNA polymerase III subunit beta n=1 Tax=Thiofilum sp. TaxID=2212733 RepID=UPI0025DA56BE|nr:DNA polymerase III subunit beta [Thiofilum sp.]MBK8452655.1 DNA polymerase III subunit beta [Thiofilum sp.]